MTAPETPRPRFSSIADLQSSALSKVLIDSKTKIIRGLFGLAPKRRRSKVRWVIALALFAVLGTLALDVSVREYSVGHATAFYRAHTTAPSAAPEPIAITRTTSVSVPVVARPPTSVADTPAPLAPQQVTPSTQKAEAPAKPSIRRPTSFRGKR